MCAIIQEMGINDHICSTVLLRIAGTAAIFFGYIFCAYFNNYHDKQFNHCLNVNNSMQFRDTEFKYPYFILNGGFNTFSAEYFYEMDLWWIIYT